MALEAFRAEYDALKIPEFPDEREWPDRVRSWEDFLANGPAVAELLRRKDGWFPDEHERLRALAPKLADLVLRAFPEAADAST